HPGQRHAGRSGRAEAGAGADAAPSEVAGADHAADVQDVRRMGRLLEADRARLQGAEVARRRRRRSAASAGTISHSSPHAPHPEVTLISGYSNGSENSDWFPAASRATSTRTDVLFGTDTGKENVAAPAPSVTMPAKLSRETIVISVSPGRVPFRP